MTEYIVLDNDEFHKVIGQIYKITNIVNGKQYIGQTRSHLLNKGKYRPYGYMKRFKSHISSSRSTCKEGCRYLVSAMLKYGIEAFKCELVTTCPLEELDDYECKYIAELKTKYPTGYNLTDGGRAARYVRNPIIEKLDKSGIIQNYCHSEETKKKISQGIKNAINNEESLKYLMTRAQQQHNARKFEKFKDVTINKENLDSHISILNKKNREFVRLKFPNKRRIDFFGKYETIKETITRAKNFLNELMIQQHVQIAGTSLET